MSRTSDSSGIEPESARYAPPVDLSKYALISIAVAVITIVLKSASAWLTGSVGLLSDAAESLVNLVAAVVAFIALKVSIKPADDGHRYGHSKAEYFSAVVEGAMIFVASVFIIVTSVERLISPRELEELGLGLGISVIAAVLNGAVGFVLLRKGKKSGSATLVADGKHLLTDVVTSVAVLVGVGVVALTGLPILDPIVALLAGVNILWTGVGLIRQSVNGLMDAALPEDMLAKLNEVLDQHRKPGVIDFHAVRTRVAGNREFMGIHVLVPGDWSVRRGHDFTEDLIDDLVAVSPSIRVAAHLEPIEDPRSYEDEHDYR